MHDEPGSGKPVLSGIALVLALSLIGLVFSAWLASTLGAAEGQGLAGAAIVLGYGVLGAVGAMALGLVLCFALPRSSVRRLGPALLALALLALTILFTLAYLRQQRQSEQDAAYEGIPAFHASLRQTVITDPHLRVYIGVDGPAREWQQTGPAPENMHCTGTVPADKLRRLAGALETLDALPAELLAPCEQAAEAATRALQWTFANPRSLPISPTCLRIHEVSVAVAQMERATIDGRDISCD